MASNHVVCIIAIRGLPLAAGLRSYSSRDQSDFPDQCYPIGRYIWIGATEYSTVCTVSTAREIKRRQVASIPPSEQ